MIKRSRVNDNDHLNHDRWLISYADFVTLLFGFFVVMYSVSQVNEEKYEQLSQVLEEMFSNAAIKKSIESVPDNNKKMNIDVLLSLKQEVQDSLSDLLNHEDVTVAQNELWLEISLNNRILFNSGSVHLKSEAVQLFSQIAPLLKQSNLPIQVEGFTDNLPIKTGQFPSNWELSTARASTVVKLLIEKGLAAERLAAVGYGEHQPIATNATRAGRAKNRRVSLLIGKHSRHRPIQIVQEPVNSADDTVAEPLSPVLLKNDELLFSSDPDLPRNNSKASVSE